MTPKMTTEEAMDVLLGLTNSAILDAREVEAIEVALESMGHDLQNARGEL